MELKDVIRGDEVLFDGVKPIPLTQEIAFHDYDEKLIYADIAKEQRAKVNRMALDICHSPCYVISTHTSKSCKLPVYAILLPNDIEIIFRDNFYDINLSVKSDYAVDLPEKLIDTESHCYLEGFSKNWSYPKYSETNKQVFTMYVGDMDKLVEIVKYLMTLGEEKEKKDYDRSECVCKLLIEGIIRDSVFERISWRAVDLWNDAMLLLFPLSFDRYLYDCCEHKNILVIIDEFTKYVVENPSVSNLLRMEAKSNYKWVCEK